MNNDVTIAIINVVGALVTASISAYATIRATKSGQTSQPNAKPVRQSSSPRNLRILSLIAGVVSLVFIITGTWTWLNRQDNTSNAIFIDNFDARRNDGFRLFETKEVSFTASIEPGYYNVDITTGEPIKYVKIPSISVSDFDYKVDFRSLEGDIFFTTRFRTTEAGDNIHFDFFANGPRIGEYYISFNDTKKGGKIAIDTLKDLRVVCKGDKCSFYVNGSNNPFSVLEKLPNTAGDFKLGFAGNGNFKIEYIKINNIE